MSKQQSERAPTRGTETVTSDVLSHLVKQFESLSTIKALCAVLAMALAMIAYIYKDFLFGNAVLLYTDIGSDSVNDQLPVWMQRAYIWSETATNSGFSLSSYLGSFMTFEMWNPFQWIIVLSGPGNINKSLIFYAVGQIAAAVIVTHVYFRVLGVAGSAAAIGSLSFAICGYHVLWSAGWSMGMFPVLFVSLGLLATEYYIQERRFSLVAPALAFVVVANSSTYFIVYWATFVSAYALLRLCETKGYRQIVKPALIFLAALAVGAVISWSSLADLYTFINDSGRAESIKVSGAVSTYGTNMNMGMFERASTDEYRSMFGRLRRTIYKGLDSPTEVS